MMENEGGHVVISSHVSTLYGRRGLVADATKRCRDATNRCRDATGSVMAHVAARDGSVGMCWGLGWFRGRANVSIVPFSDQFIPMNDIFFLFGQFNL